MRGAGIPRLLAWLRASARCTPPAVDEKAGSLIVALKGIQQCGSVTERRAGPGLSDVVADGVVRADAQDVTAVACQCPDLASAGPRVASR